MRDLLRIATRQDGPKVQLSGTFTLLYSASFVGLTNPPHVEGAHLGCAWKIVQSPDLGLDPESTNQ